MDAVKGKAVEICVCQLSATTQSYYKTSKASLRNDTDKQQKEQCLPQVIFFS